MAKVVDVPIRMANIRAIMYMGLFHFVVFRLLPKYTNRSVAQKKGEPMMNIMRNCRMASSSFGKKMTVLNIILVRKQQMMAFHAG